MKLFGDNNACFGRLAQDGLDAGVSILDERTGIAIEVDGFLGVERHVLAGIYLQNEILQRTQTYDAGDVIGLGLRQTVQLTQLATGFLGGVDHLFHQVVSIDYRTLTALHLAFGQFHHTIGEVYQALAPLKAQTVEQDGQHLEVIVLLVAHHVDHLVDGIVGETLFGRTDVLRHVDRRTVSTEQQLVVEAFAREVGPHGTVFLAVEKTFLQSFEHFLLAFQVCVRFVVYLVEADAHHLVSFVEAGIYPVVHLLPQGTYFRVTSLPLHEHLAGFLHQGRFSFGLSLGFFLVHAFGLILGHQLLHFSLEVFVESHVVVTNEVVTLFAARLGRLAVAILQPRQHRLADVDTAVVHDVGFHHTVAVGGNDIGQGVA